jgi:tRNA(fMet)-specific endonuclease VapC
LGVKLALDTNAYRKVMDGDEPAMKLIRRADVVCMPVPVIAELRFGFLNGTRGRQNEATLREFLDEVRVEVLECDDETATWFAQLKLQLKRQGTPIPLNDVWIAALVMQHQAELFTYDSDFDTLAQLPKVAS